MKKGVLLACALLWFASCSKKEPEPPVTIDATTLELKYDKTHQYVLTKGTAPVTASTYTWKSSDEKVGTIDANGNFKARKIGETTVTGTSTGGNVESKISIKPYTTFFAEPSVQFGTDVATIKAKEKRKLAATSTAEVLIYEGENASIRLVAYFFENAKMVDALVLFAGTSAVLTESSTFYKERYPDITSDQTAVYILNDEQTFGIIVSNDADFGYNAEYVPYKKGGRVSADAQKASLEKLKKLGVL